MVVSRKEMLPVGGAEPLPETKENSELALTLVMEVEVAEVPVTVRPTIGEVLVM